MLGKTHMAVEIAATLAITRPQSFTQMILAVGVGSIGAVISDIDVGTSQSHKEADKVIAVTTITILGIGMLDYFLQLGIWNKMKDSRTIYQLMIIVIGFLGICIYGKEQPHRSFMHSFLALILLSGIIGMIYPGVIIYFAIGFLSHLMLDIFNYKKVRLFYPLKKGICFRMFHADGMANHIAFITGVIVAVTEAVLLLLQK